MTSVADTDLRSRLALALDVAAIGGKGEDLETALRRGFTDDMTLRQAFELGVSAFREVEQRESEGWEMAVLDRSNGRRTFRRVEPSELSGD